MKNGIASRTNLLLAEEHRRGSTLHQDGAYAGHAQADGDGCAEGQQQHKDTQ
jgi:hypothetical protein